MALHERLEEDYKTALRAGDKDRVSTLRLVKAGILNKYKEKGEDVDEAGILDVLSAAAKQRKESVQAYEEGGRDDLRAKEQRELDILQEYLPEAMSAEEVAARVADVIAEVGATAPKDTGRVMKVLMAELKGRAEGGLVNQLVKERLAPSS
ncbi:MAG: GatB/YqeY domain-containing protein [bacterium]|nr:GatB/YqeY domain-containing protein [bacterium]